VQVLESILFALDDLLEGFACCELKVFLLTIVE